MSGLAGPAPPGEAQRPLMTHPRLPPPRPRRPAGAGAVTDNTWEELVLKSPVPVLVRTIQAAAVVCGSKQAA
jgi:hypothetical protein